MIGSKNGFGVWQVVRELFGQDGEECDLSSSIWRDEDHRFGMRLICIWR